MSFLFPSRVFRNKYEMDDGILYVKSVCMVCRNRTYACDYCNGEGRTFIEASDKTIADWIKRVEVSRRNNIIESVMEGDQNETG